MARFGERQRNSRVLRARLPVILRCSGAVPDTGEFPRRFPEPAAWWIRKITDGAVTVAIGTIHSDVREDPVRYRCLPTHEADLSCDQQCRQGRGVQCVRTLERSEARPLASDASSAQTDAS
jgi:hypothetical protein